MPTPIGQATTTRSLSLSLRHTLHGCAYQGLVLPLGGASGISLYALVSTGRFSPALFAAVFLFIYASYMVDHLTEVDNFGDALSSARSSQLRKRKRLQISLAIGAFLVSVAISAAFSGYAAAAFIFVFPASVALYGTPLLGKLTAGWFGVYRIKDIPYIKSFYTVFFWGLLVPFAALFLGGRPPAYLLLFFFAFISSRVFVNTVFCDLKDLERDRAEGVMTFAVGLGVERTLRVLHLVNVLSMLTLVALIFASLLPIWVLPVAIVGFYTHWLLEQATRPYSDIGFLCDVAMDGELALWLPCTALGTAIVQWFS